ncbi:MAG: hypothetical protein U0704_08820 [Candidatus Eisenbacteria bacterium]
MASCVPFASGARGRTDTRPSANVTSAGSPSTRASTTSHAPVMPPVTTGVPVRTVAGAPGTSGPTASESSTGRGRANQRATPMKIASASSCCAAGVASRASTSGFVR